MPDANIKGRRRTPYTTERPADTGLIDSIIANSTNNRKSRTNATTAADSSDLRSSAEGKAELEVSRQASSSSRGINQELWRWTMTADAVAACFVRDVLDMNECDDKSADFFWLGRVPCRSVRIVGLVVGVQMYEKKMVVTVDDGTAVIDCNYRHLTSAAPHQSSGRNEKATPAKANTQHPQLEDNTLQDSETLLHVGMPVQVVGRVVKWHDTRVVTVDELKLCSSANDEPSHWLSVCDLHRTYYASSIGPFVILAPSQTVQSDTNAPSSSQPKEKPEKLRQRSEPATPSGSSVASSVHTSPISLAESISDSQTPVRLRHPTRLHTRDLTANTFRIYLKHYMDHAPEDECAASTDDDSDISITSHAFPETPTKRKRTPLRNSYENFADATPRPSSRWQETPRVHRKHKASVSCCSATPADEQPSNSIQGYTLSHLRRVPELQLLAHRIVLAEAKRRAREERAKVRELQSQASSSSKSKVPCSAPSASGSRGPSRGKDGEPVGPKIKRLFRFAIRQLFDDGSIVLWDGPVRSLPTHRRSMLSSLSIAGTSSGRNRLWKGDALQEDSSVFSASVSAHTSVIDDPGEISDAPPGEESYIPLTTLYLSNIVERTIQEIVALPPASSSSISSKLWDLSTTSHVRAGPTMSEILGHLQRRDERWARVGEWAIKDALEHSKQQGKVWCVGGGRWELCG